MHDGFRFRGTLGPGYVSYGEGNSNLHGLAGASGIYLGTTLPPSLGLGGSLSITLAPAAGYDGTGGATYRLALITLGPYVDYYFRPRGGLHALGTAGFAVLDVVDTQFDEGYDLTGFSLGAGLGYDFWVGSEASLGVLGRVQYAHFDSEYLIAPTMELSFVWQ